MNETMNTVVRNATNGKKISAGAIAIGISGLGFWALGEFTGVVVPVEVAAMAGGALQQIVSLVIPDEIEA